jgi:hypothetical protein
LNESYRVPQQKTVQIRKILMNLMQFADVIEKFPSFSVLVIGDIMLDTYEYCLTSESRFLHSEKSGKRAYKSQNAVKVLGGAGNVAVTLSISTIFYANKDL